MNAGFGVIVHNGEGNVTYFLKENDVAIATLKGTVHAEGVEAKLKGYELALKRITSTNPKAPIAKGTLRIGKRTINVAAFLNPDHTVGLSEDTGVAKAEWPWPTA